MVSSFHALSDCWSVWTYIHSLCVWLPYNTYQFEIFLSDILSWRKSSTKFTSMSYNFSDALPIYSHGSLHWIRKCNDILAFHVKKREARTIELPRNLPLPFVNRTSWFGVVNGLLTIISISREEISVWILSDYNNVEWVLKTRITNILNSEWSIRIPSFWWWATCYASTKARGRWLGLYVWYCNR